MLLSSRTYSVDAQILQSRSMARQSQCVQLVSV